MKQRLLLFFCFIFLAVATYSLSIPHGQPLSAGRPILQQKILLLPLDSRPPCGQFVVDAGRIAGIDVILPPPELLDYYTQAGDTAALQAWLQTNIKGASAVILSLDQLIHGGLLSAREKTGDTTAEFAALSFLTQLHTDNPEIPLYAFQVLPRIQPQASIESYTERKALIKYSRLSEEVAIFDNENDLAEMREIEGALPPAVLERYRQIYKKNTLLNERLARMTKEGILKRLVIGQDDSEDFGIPNMEKQQIQHYLAAENIPSSVVSLTRGADEVALTLLAEIATEMNSSWQPKIYVEYNEPRAAGIVMPYMSCSVATTVREKITLLHGLEVDSPDKADFTLFVHIGNDKNLNTRRQSAHRLKSLLQQGYKIALVDLSHHFLAEETLFPQLLQQNVPLNQLVAYAGWNTTSNSVGTAIAQANIFTARLANARTTDSLLALYQQNLHVLNNRYLEDYFYLKDLIGSVNENLQKAGYRNVYDLDMDHNYHWANDMLQTGISKRAGYLKNLPAYRQPLTVSTPKGEIRLYVRDLQAEAYYPWPRTFEIHLQSRLQIERLP